jgi:DNA polymerase-3 subunit alpha
MGNTDKILVYINDCREHGVKILPPDVNESFRYFSVQSQEEIRFGLAAVKGVGEAAIGSIIEARKRIGKFPSLFDFCANVDLRRVNKKVLESLIKCGAFDSISPIRAQLMSSLDMAMEWGAKRQQESLIGQTNMFDLLPTEAAIPQMSSIAEWPEAEKLAFEKEALGFYITGHPLRRYQDQIRRLAGFDTQKCVTAIDKSEVGLCGMVTSLKEIVTRKGGRMAFVTLEDLVGTIEVVVFTDVYTSVANLLKTDAPIYIKGTVDHNEDSVKILAKEILSLDDLRIRKTKAVHLTVSRELMTRDALEEFKGLLSKFPGSIPTFLHLIDPAQQETVLALPRELEIGLSEEFIVEVERLFGSSALVLN